MDSYAFGHRRARVRVRVNSNPVGRGQQHYVFQLWYPQTRAMETTSIALDREAYDLLRGQKRPGESFSQVVKRLAGSRRPLSSFVGAWKDMPEKTYRGIQAGRRHLRNLDERRFERLMRGER